MTWSRPLRRLVAVSVCAVCLLVPQALVLAVGRSPQLGGDDGSGPPPGVPRTVGASAGPRWSDVPKDLWARTAIDYVAGANEWMRDPPPAADGTYPFWPDRLESRRLFARALVRAFAPDAAPDPNLELGDLPATDRLFPYVNVAVSQGWMQTDPEGNFQPTQPVTVRVVHRALVLALGMGDLAAGADALHLRNGTKIPTPEGFGTLLIGMLLGFRYNHGDEALDLDPDSPLSRAETAWSLYRAATTPEWIRSALEPFATIELPNLSPRMQQVVAFGVGYVGYPYVWGGEWADPTPDGYCCGYQPVGGFDCSGFTWWLMKAEELGWDNTPPRGYTGWALPQRSSAQMAAVGTKVRWDDLRPGDLMFYDGDGDGTVDHVDTYIGNGWALDSGSSNGGVTITRVEGTWYQDHFVKGRRITAWPAGPA